MKNKAIFNIFFGLTCLAVLSVLFVDTSIAFPFITSKALFFRIFALAALPFYLFLVTAQKQLRPNLKNPLTISLLAFLALSLISGFVGVDPAKSFWGDIERMGGTWNFFHLTLLYFYILVLGQNRGGYILKFLKFFSGLAIICALYGLWVLAGLPAFFPDPSLPIRVSSLFGNPIFFASFLILPLFLSIFFALQAETKTWRWVYLAVALIQFIGIYQSATRGAFVGLVVAGIFAGGLYAFKSGSGKIRRRNSGIFMGFLAFLILVFIVGSKVNQHSFLYRLTHLQDGNSAARLIQWKTALKGFKDRPVLGTGPENYYIVADSYYNPEIFKYDKNWFDKPHNYLLEILVTGGSLGFVAYCSIVFSMFWIFWKAFKAGLLLFGEMCVLTAGIVAYQIQNLFVFDTVAASISFFVFVGFAGYLWHEIVSVNEDTKKNKISSKDNLLYAQIVFGVSLVLVIYTISVADMEPWAFMENLNSALTHQANFPDKSYEYFKTASEAPFNFDPGQLGLRYEDFAVSLIHKTDGSVSKSLVNNTLDGAISALNKAIEQTNNHPVYFYKLAEAYLAKAAFNNTALDPVAEKDAEKALALAPGRIEPLTVLGQVKVFENKNTEAMPIIEKVIATYPTEASPYWRLAFLYHNLKQDDKAAPLAMQALDRGYVPQDVTDMLWLAQYYTNKGSINDVIILYSKLTEVDSGNTQWYASLAAAYLKNGQKDKAIETAKRILEFDPSAKDLVKQFIDTLK